MLAMADSTGFQSVARDLAHAGVVGDPILQGNALVQLKELACQGNPRAAALLGRKYLSGEEEFQKDLDQSRRYLTFAASRGEGESVTDLPLLLLGREGDAEAHAEAYTWLQVARYSLGSDAVLVRFVESALALSEKATPLPDALRTKADERAGIIIHHLRNGLDNPQFEPPC